MKNVTLTNRVTLTAGERVELLRLLELDQRIEGHRRLRPLDFYRPHQRGQEQFHRSGAIIRCLFPGNGFGKTTAAGAEVQWWVTHSHPWQKIPNRPLIVIWCCETYKQFKILRGQLEGECLGPVAKRPYPHFPHFNGTENCYHWPDGSVMYLVSGDSSWTHIQGINPDLVVFDEEPPEALWNEMKMRRRGVRKTRYVFAATATQGMTWMHRDLYVPWLEHHTRQNLTEDQAHAVQNHPRLWVWARGGIDDNPGADAGDRDWYHAQRFNSEAERRVRLAGGFADFSGTPVFDLAALERLQPGIVQGEIGRFVYVPPINPDDHRCITITEKTQPRRVMLAFVAEGSEERGRVEVWKRPIAGHQYVIGHDTAYGLRTADWDAAVVLDRETGEQVAEAHGHWGPERFAEILLALGWWFNQAFVCGERQVGLVTMRRLYDEFGYTYQYFRRDEAKRSRIQSEDLGHHRIAGDLTIPRLRTAIGRRGIGGKLMASDLVIRSRELHRQLVRFQWRPSSSTKSIHECRDADLECGAPVGDHDDLVLAAGYAQMAMHEVSRFTPKPLPYPEGSYGAVFKLDEVLSPRPKKAEVFDHE